MHQLVRCASHSALSRSHRIHSPPLSVPGLSTDRRFSKRSTLGSPSFSYKYHRPIQPARFGSRRSLPLISGAYLGVSWPVMVRMDVYTVSLTSR